MKTLKKFVAGFSVLALSAAFALPADAKINLYGETDAAVNVGAGVTGSAGSNGANTAVNSNTNVDVKVDLGANGSASSSGNGSSGSGSGSTSGSASGDSSVSVDANGALDIVPILITRADVDTNAVESTSVSAANVKSDADLKGFVAAEIKGDKNVSQVETSAENVAVTYNQHAKLFGFIPVKVKATAVVDANGDVSVSYPWWTVLAATDKAALEAELQAKVDAAFSANQNGADASASAEATAKLSSDAQARLVSEIRKVMETKFNASAAANASADASAEAGN
jgi:hypothetical protein